MTLVKLAILFLIPSFLAAAPLSPEQKECTFKSPVIVGASISAQTAMSLPLYHTGISVLAARRGQFFLPAFGPSPATILLVTYAGQGPFLKGKDYSKMFTQTESDWGSTQIRALLNGSEKAALDSASVVIGVDAFYWDAIADSCGYGSDAGVEKVIEALIATAKRKKIKLILGNVPQEDPSTVLIDSESLGIPGLWYQPTPLCVESINRTLSQLCEPSEGCYVIDIAGMVTKLNRGDKLKLRNGTAHGLYSLRPDGVHLSTHGSSYIYEQILAALEAHPPQCK